MNKEELKQEAEQYSYDVPIYQIEQQLEKIQKAYLAGAEPREKRIEELEAQIEKMKSDVISERDEAKRLEDTITYVVLNNILAKWGVKEK